MSPKALVEAALFVSDKPLTVEQLLRITGIANEESLRDILDEIKKDLRTDGRGVELIEIPEGFELRVKREYRDKVVNLAPLSDLSEGMLRTLAIIALKQPIKQSVIVHYQGNKTYGYIKALEDKGLVKTEKLGRTKLITAAHGFEKYFGKSTEEMRAMLKRKLEKEKIQDGGAAETDGAAVASEAGSAE